MARFEENKEIVYLLAKAVQGELTEVEREKLVDWQQRNEENEKLYQRILSAEFLTEKSRQHQYFNISVAYFKVRNKCLRNSRKKLISYISTIAASVLLLLGGVWFLVHDESSPKKVVVVQSTIEPGATKAELILAGGQRVWLGENNVDSVFEESGVQIYSTGKCLNYTGGDNSDEIQYNILRVPRGGEYTVTLQDGTVIYLNSASELRYPVQFVGDERRVFLMGEGYFQVAKNKDCPFIVDVNGAEIEVLGTSFNVCAYEEEGKTETTLVEGTVCFATKGKHVILEPGEQGILNTAGNLIKQKVDVYPYIAWKEGQFVFRKRTLEEVMRVVARWYDVQVVFESNELKGISFSGNIKRYDDFGQVVRMLEMTGGLEFKIEGKTIYITEN